MSYAASDDYAADPKIYELLLDMKHSSLKSAYEALRLLP